MWIKTLGGIFFLDQRGSIQTKVRTHAHATGPGMVTLEFWNEAKTVCNSIGPIQETDSKIVLRKVWNSIKSQSRVCDLTELELRGDAK